MKRDGSAFGADGWRLGRLLGDRRGQMTVELAVVFPVALAIVYVMINVMMYLSACARFDPLAAEAVRTMAATPASDSFDIGLRAGRAESLLEQNLAGYDNVTVSVSARETSYGGLAESSDSEANAILIAALLPRQEEYVCTLRYRPWGFPDGIFGVHLFEVEHEARFVIDPYRPGVTF